MHIRKASLLDIDALQRIGTETFKETFAADNSENNLSNYINTAFSIEKMKEELNNEKSAFFFVEDEGRVIGYLKINREDAQSEDKLSNSMEIERIYVLKEFHGKKVGQLLFNKAIEIAHQYGVKQVWLGVWEHNPRAIRFYEKNGFKLFDKHIFTLGDDEQTDHLMKFELT